MAKALEYDTSGTPDVLLSTTWYYYNVLGSVTRVVKNVAGTDDYESTWFEYAKNGTAVSYVLNESWTWDGVGDPAGYQILEAREFRYDGARERYLNRKLDPAGLQQNPPQYVSLSDTWTDYDGDEPYGDFSVSGSTASNLRSFELGLATVDPWMGSTRIRTKYYHDDHLGTTLTTTDKNATPGPFRVRTAFGEPVAGPADRYGYAGAWGYQSTLDETSGQPAFSFLHVGARYYDPSSGRFLQRDPIGIEGGINVYDYVRGQATLRVDPDGLWLGPAIRGAIWLAKACGKVISKLKKAPKKQPPPKKTPPPKKPPKKEPPPENEPPGDLPLPPEPPDYDWDKEAPDPDDLLPGLGDDDDFEGGAG